MKRHEQALLHLNKAREDEDLLDEVLDSPRVSDAIVGFHCQQAAEKLLKAVHSEYGVRFRWTHDLRELVDSLTDAGYAPPSDLQCIDVLTPYGTFWRYEGLPGQPALDRPAARAMVRRLRAWAEEKIGK
jgi:HEPN domain-containing protein